LRLDFLIVCLGRTGSSHLASLLDSHPGIVSRAEFFNADDGGFDRWPGGDHRAFVADYAGFSDDKVCGFKLPLDSLVNYPVLLDFLRDERVRIIRLVRPNRLAHLVSARLAQQTGVWHSHQGEQPSIRVRLGVDECLAWFRDGEYHDAILDELTRRHPTYRIRYEELSDPRRLDELQRFLRVAPMPLCSDSRRQRRRPLAEVVENWDEVADGLRGTGWEQFLEGAGASGPPTG
jgi:hypothetical protein